MEVSPIDVRDANEIESAIATFAREANRGLLVMGGGPRRSPMALLPIYFGNREASVKATMVFPREPERARVFAAWLIVRWYGLMVEAGLRPSGVYPPDVGCAAAEFAYLYHEAQQNLKDSAVAGIITVVLDSLICDDINTASWTKAVQIAEKLCISYNREHGTNLKANRSQYLECLAKFGPALHLLGARTMRRQDEGDGFDRIIDLRSDPAVNYRRRDDLLFFVFEAKQFQLSLYWWDRGWDCRRSPVSQHLREMFEIDGSWTPPPRQPGWPDTVGTFVQR
jgi:hypothetical protein